MAKTNCPAMGKIRMYRPAAPASKAFMLLSISDSVHDVKFPAELLLVNENSSEYISLLGAAKEVWQALKGAPKKITTQHLFEILSQEWDINSSENCELIQEAIETLRAAGAISVESE